MQEMTQVTLQLPAFVSQLAEQHQLGQFHALYRRRLHRFLLWFLPAWLTLGITILSYDGYRLFLDYNALMVSPLIQFWGSLAHLVFGITVLALGALGVNPFWGFKKCLYVMDNGLLYTNGKKAEIVRWDEIEAIFWWKKRGISSFCCKDGSKFRMIEEIEKAQEISAIMAGAVTEHLLLDALAHYQETGKVHFGPLSVTRGGIANWNSSQVASWETIPVISWAEIEDVRFEKGKLGMKVSKRWKYWNNGFMQAHTISNPTVCVALIRHILGTRDEQKRELAISDV
ncbi:MAG TPA: DUF6585 family protein [Ktedonobacteraceae bacterium]|nr:DUF6585 family protein [Ktedonobacteraceae bacterium]